MRQRQSPRRSEGRAETGFTLLSDAYVGLQGDSFLNHPRGSDLSKLTCPVEPRHKPEQSTVRGTLRPFRKNLCQRRD